MSPCVVLTEEHSKREKEGSGGYQAVGFTYSDSVPAEKAQLATAPLVPPRPQHPPTSTVDVVENETDRFVVPAGLAIPPHIKQV